MTSIQVRTDRGQADAGADILLDWFDRSTASTIRYDADFLKGLAPSAVARDLLRVGGAVYCADKVVLRSDCADSWTRRLSLQIPVSDHSRWDLARAELSRALSFLSGDLWELEFVNDGAEPTDADVQQPEFQGVSLFSGGLDSLAGAIDKLEAGRSLCLVGHHDSGMTDSTQKALFKVLRKRYGAKQTELRRLYLRPGWQRTGPARPLPNRVENTTRSRSFLFFAAGIAVADALGATVPLLVPENGFIGINVPLTAARAGSLSTRTTHPLYMHRIALVLERLGLRHTIDNPYRLMTKGEELEQSANQKLLLDLAPQTISCSHPEAPRWAKRPQGNCGYCYPCLIRRASLHHVGADHDRYAWDALNDADLLSPRRKRGRSLRAVTASLGREERIEDVLLNGRIPNGETRKFFEVYQRGRAELRAWLTGAGPALRRRLNG